MHTDRFLKVWDKNNSRAPPLLRRETVANERQFMTRRNNPRKFDIKDYDYYVAEYISKSEKHGKPISHTLLRKEPFDLPDARWYIRLCPNKTVTNWREFEDWCGFYVSKLITKDKAASLIYKMQKILNRPLVYDDFRGTGCYQVSIGIVNKYWGSMNKMKRSLGLEIVQENMLEKSLDKRSFDIMIKDIVEYVNYNNRNFITTLEINSNKEWLNSKSLRKTALKYYNKTLSELLAEHHIQLGKKGSGINYTFKDGEHTTSQYEYMFSKFLRDNGFEYNKSYFRDVRYSTFIDNYKKMMNCDYVVHINGENIYIEIAGIIELFKKNYYDNKIITCSKSKETYRVKLKEKEEMLKKQGLNYFFLFPCDLTNDNFFKIITNPSIELKNTIEIFIKNNIEWNKIRKLGELKYTDKIKWGRTQIDYGEAI